MESDAKGSSVGHNLNVEIDAKGSSVGHNLNFKPRKDPRHDEYASNICSDGQRKTECQLQCFTRETTTPSTHSVNSDSEEDRSYKGIMDSDHGTSHNKGSKFEVGAAEELDMLLNSFNGTHLSSSTLDAPLVHNSTLQGMKTSLLNEKAEPSLSSKPPILAALDDALDDLLSETSLPVQNEGFATQSLTSQATANSGQSIDFRYAKKIDVTPSIDDSVDCLLEDTSSCLSEAKPITTAQGSNNTPLDSVPQHSGSLNASDDFDSWFDSL